MILCLVVLTAIFCSVWFEESPWFMVAEPLIKPFTNSDYPLGTDMLGRDLGAGLAYGARMSLLVGVVSTLVAVILGVLVGSLAGFYGGRTRRRCSERCNRWIGRRERCINSTSSRTVR